MWPVDHPTAFDFVNVNNIRYVNCASVDADFFAFALSDQFMTSLTVDYGGVGYKIGVSAIRGSCRD